MPRAYERDLELENLNQGPDLEEIDEPEEISPCPTCMRKTECMRWGECLAPTTD